MSTNVLPSSITLTVLNPEKLLQGSEPRHRFDRAGGSIGSQGAWRLHDRGVRILPVHCEIGWHEGHFCIIDHSGKSFMNGSYSQLLSGTPIRLRHNDRLQMGDYQIAIHLGEDEVEPEPHTGRDPLCELGVNQQMCPLQILGVAFVGFEANEALLPSPGEQMDGYRILHEFFCFPERFHGFRIDGLGSYWPDEAAVHIQLEFGFSAPLPPDIQIDQTTILLNCIPAINLFSCTAEPIPLNGQALCETVRMGRQGGKKGEIFSIDRVSSQRQKSSDHIQDFKPFEALDRDFPLAEPTPARYYKLDIEQEPVNDKVQHRISLVHHNLAPYLGLHEELNIDLTCSNGPLAQQLRVGEVDVTTQDTPSFVAYRNLTRPTRSYPPMLQSGGQGERHWALLSNLALNNLSLSSPATLAAVLRVYDFVAAHDLQQERNTTQRLDAIRQVDNEPCDWLVKGVPVRGMRTTLHIDPAGFECEGEVQLFGNVLSHFMTLYANSNSFHQLQIINPANATRQLWPARTGRQPVM